MMKIIQVVAGVILQNRQVLIAQRPYGKHLAGLWEFPGGKVEANETPEAALKRELHEELGIEIQKVGPFIAEVTHAYPEKTIRLLFYQITEFTGEFQLHEHAALAWIKVNEIENYQFPEADQPILQWLSSELNA